MEVRALLIGDVVGKPGRELLKKALPELIEERNVDFVIVNGENAVQGSGINAKSFKEIVRSGADVVTLGDHTWNRKEAVPVIESEERCLRPMNYSPKAVGKGARVYTLKNGMRALVAIVLGRVFMPPVDCPLRAIDNALTNTASDVEFRFIEVHAEATSEKVAMGWKLDGKATCVYGTHTHVPTADARVLPKGTAYITDLGMTGPHDSVIGRSKVNVLHRFETSMHAPFDVAHGDVRMCGVFLTLESSTGLATSIERIEIRENDLR